MVGFDWWLLIVGLVVGGGLTWLVVADTRRREVDVEQDEIAREALWLSDVMSGEGDPISSSTAEHVLHLHRAYLAAPPPDEFEPDGSPDAESIAAAGEVPAARERKEPSDPTEPERATPSVR